MGFNSSVLSGRLGSLRFFTIILGAIVVGLSFDCVFRSVRDEEFFLWTFVTILIVSIIVTISAFLGLFQQMEFIQKIDSLFHMIGGIIALVAGILMLISVINIGQNSAAGVFIERLAIGIIGILVALIYCSLGMSLFRSST